MSTMRKWRTRRKASRNRPTKMTVWLIDGLLDKVECENVEGSALTIGIPYEVPNLGVVMLTYRRTSLKEKGLVVFAYETFRKIG